jgi:hypothetical protein
VASQAVPCPYLCFRTNLLVVLQMEVGLLRMVVLDHQMASAASQKAVTDVVVIHQMVV